MKGPELVEWSEPREINFDPAAAPEGQAAAAPEPGPEGQVSAAPEPLYLCRIERLVASNGARFIHAIPLGEPAPDHCPFIGEGVLRLDLPGLGPVERPLTFRLDGATDERTAAEIYPAALEAARGAQLARLRERIAAAQSGSPLVLPGAALPGLRVLPGQKDFPPRRKERPR